MSGEIDVYRTGSRTAPGGPWAGVNVRGSTCSFFTRGKIQHPVRHPSGFCESSIFTLAVWLPILSSVLQVISLRDQIKRRQQGVDGGKDVREGLHACWFQLFCVCVRVQRLCSEVDVWVDFCFVIFDPFRTFWSSLFTSLIHVSPPSILSSF